MAITKDTHYVTLTLNTTERDVATVTRTNNKVTIMTSDDHGFVDGQVVKVELATYPQVNGRYTITTDPNNADTFSFVCVGEDFPEGSPDPETGSVTGVRQVNLPNHRTYITGPNQTIKMTLDQYNNIDPRFIGDAAKLLTDATA